MLIVKRQRFESVDHLIARFRRRVRKEGLLQEATSKMFFVPKNLRKEAKRRKKQQLAKFG